MKKKPLWTLMMSTSLTLATACVSAGANVQNIDPVQQPVIMPERFVPIEVETADSAAWKQVSGPGQVLFSSLDSPQSLARFPKAGTYRLQYGTETKTIRVLKQEQLDETDRTYWFGNTWGNSGWEKGPTGKGISYYKHREGAYMQMDIDDLYVFPDGTLVTNTLFDEGLNPISFYREINGEPIKLSGSGYGRLMGGRGITSNGTHIFATANGRYGGPNFLVRLTLDGETAPVKIGKNKSYKVLLRKHPKPPYNRNLVPPQGIAAIGKEVFWADSVDRVIQVWGADTLVPIRNFPLDMTGTAGDDIPLKMDADSKGRLWIVQRDRKAVSRIRLYQTDGTWTGREIVRSGWAPMDIDSAVVKGKERMYVADAGPDQQVHVFADADKSPRLVHSYGVKGGVLAGPIRGKSGPERLFYPSGVGVDAEGNVYVASDSGSALALEDKNIYLYGQRRGQGFGTVMAKFTPKGKEAWRLEGLEFVESAHVDPVEDEHVFTKDSHYVLDYTLQTEEGTEHPSWTHVGWTIDPMRYPNDPRLFYRHEDLNVKVFRADGKRFFATGGRSGVAVYRFDGEIAVPTMVIAGAQKQFGSWPPYRPKCTYLWQDGSGKTAPDGQFQADEYSEIDSSTWSKVVWEVDDNGTVWISEGKLSTVHRFQAALKQGVPMYSIKHHDSVKISGIPQLEKKIVSIKGMTYHSDKDIMYLAGDGKFTKHRNFTLVGRYESWSKTFDSNISRNPEHVWTIEIPNQDGPKKHDDPDDRHPETFDVAGDYVFVGYRRLGTPFPDGVPEEVLIWRINDQKQVHILRPGPEVGYWVGDTEMQNSMSAHQRQDGSYVVIQEANDYSKMIYWVWKP